MRVMKGNKYLLVAFYLVCAWLLTTSGAILGAQTQNIMWAEEWQADPAFYNVWARGDAPVAMGVAARSWLWGPIPFAVANEPYAESLTGRRLVEYLDKGRMEVNDPAAPRNTPWFVTSGLLVYEMVTGQRQVGNTSFEGVQPADVPVAGDPGSPNAPTYATFARHLVSAEKATGSLARYKLGVDGNLTPFTDVSLLSDPKPVTLAQYDETSRHNIPAVFADWMGQRGAVLEEGRLVQAPLLDLLYVLGRPITEAYWADVLVGGAPATVLVQLYERRALTYNPKNAPQWRVEMANVGRAYYSWRYGEAKPEPAISVSAQADGVLVKGWNWTLNSPVAVRADLAGRLEPLSGPIAVAPNVSGRFSLLLPITPPLRSALLAKANIQVRSTSSEASAALPLAGELPTPTPTPVPTSTPRPTATAAASMRLEGTISHVAVGQDGAWDVRLLTREGREWALTLVGGNRVLYSEGEPATIEDIRAGVAAQVEGTQAGERVAMVTTLRLLSLSRTGAQISYEAQPEGKSLRVSGTGWPPERVVALAIAPLGTGGAATSQPLATAKADSRGNLSALVGLPSVFSAGPLWLHATALDKDKVLAQVIAPFEPANSAMPPQLITSSRAGEQLGGVGSYCWGGKCADKVGVPLPSGSLPASAGETLGLRSMYGPDPEVSLHPTSFTARLYTYPDNPAGQGAIADGVFYFRPSSQPVYGTGEIPGRPFSITLPSTLPKGKYALVIAATWTDQTGGKGDGIYGFNVQVP